MKLVAANILIIITYFILKFFVYIPVNIITIIIFEIAFIIYDFVYSKFIDYYNEKLRRFVNK